MLEKHGRRGELSMYDEKQNQVNIKELSEYIQKNHIIPFIGAGMSCPIYPTWKKFLEQIPYSNDIEAVKYVQQAFQCDSQDYEAIAQYFYERYAVEFIDKTKRTFSGEKITIDKINRAAFAIPKLFTGPVITTNLDHMIEWVYEKNDIPLPIGLADETGFLNERLSGFAPCLWKIHGDIDKTDSWVLTSENYARQYSRGSTKFIDLFCSVLQYRRLLFLGSSLQSDKVVFLLRELYKKNNNIRHYAILPEPDEKVDFYSEMSRLANLGIKVIWYPNGNYDVFEKIVSELVEKSGKSMEYPCLPERVQIVSEIYPESEEEIRESENVDDIEEQYNLGEGYAEGKGVEQDFSKAAYYYRRAAKQGHIKSQFRLGRMYEIGVGVKRNKEEAVYWLSQAAEQGDSSSQFELGRILLNKGQGFEAQFLEAAQYFQKAAEQGNFYAQEELGWMYRRGVGVEQDHEKAAYWFRTVERSLLQSAKHGDLDSQVRLGDMYEVGYPGIKKNCIRAVEWYRRAAKQGHCDAQMRLGLIYEKGREVEQDYEEAISWYKKAASQEHMGAIKHLSKMYEKRMCTEEERINLKKWYEKAENHILEVARHGKADAQNYLALLYKKTDIKKCIYWLREAAEHGDVEAIQTLAWMYLHGDGVKENYGLAIEWYQKAETQGSTYAMVKLGDIYEGGRYVERNYEIAKVWYWKAARQGDKEAVRRLGNMYEKGLGETSNCEQAIPFYIEFARKGDNYARRRLGYMYENGIGVKRRYEIAIQYYQEAAAHGDAEAQFCLAHMYEEGNGVFKDIETAIYWYKRIGKNDFAIYSFGKAGFKLGQLYISGIEVEQNYKKAIKWFKKAAECFDTNSMAYLGHIYEVGEGVDIDYKEAVSWYQKAAKRSNCVAQYHLGLMYESGKGVCQNEQEAAKWYQKAANVGFKEAQIQLAKIYEKRGDYAKAKEWYHKADEQKIDSISISMLKYSSDISCPSYSMLR